MGKSCGGAYPLPFSNGMRLGVVADFRGGHSEGVWESGCAGSFLRYG